VKNEAEVLALTAQVEKLQRERDELREANKSYNGREQAMIAAEAENAKLRDVVEAAKRLSQLHTNEIRLNPQQHGIDTSGWAGYWLNLAASLAALEENNE
jgi:hypothetical protein